MLEHQKKILANLRKNRGLFFKELEKSIKWLTAPEVKQLELWLQVEMDPFYDSDARRLFSK